jgi:hypothetical protein
MLSGCKPYSFHNFLIKKKYIFKVVKQLNMAVILKGREGPVYEKEELKNFCLV